jgi:hypothetical protein
MPTETYLGDEITVQARRYRDTTLKWTVVGSFTTYDENDDLFGTYAVEDAFDMGDPVNEAAVAAFGDDIATVIATSLDVDAEKLSAPGSPGTPPVTLTEDYLGDDLYVTCKRMRSTEDGLLTWTIFANGATYDDETDEQAAIHYVDDLQDLLSGGTEGDLQDLGAAIQTELAANRGVLEERP